jgi:hypothetical protein
MADTRPFAEYKQHIERLSSWLASTNANIYEVLQSVNKQRALLIIKVCFFFQQFIDFILSFSSSSSIESR